MQAVVDLDFTRTGRYTFAVVHDCVKGVYPPFDDAALDAILAQRGINTPDPIPKFISDEVAE